MSRTKKLMVWMLFAIPAFVLASDFVLAGKPGPPPLPNVRYRIKFIQLPDNTDDAGFWLGGMTSPFKLENAWQVQLVGKSLYLDGRGYAFLYDPTRNPNQGIDLNSWFIDSNGVPLPDFVPPAFPNGYHLESAWDINDEGVVVGRLKNELGSCCGFAIDLAIPFPALDLMPTDGATESWPVKINENGDILFRCRDASGYGSFLFNPGYYGDPNVRPPRTGPLDFSNLTSEDARLQILHNKVGRIQADNNFQLNNPIAERPAQIAGTTVSGLPFRYTVGTEVPEVFTFPVAGPPAGVRARK